MAGEWITRRLGQVAEINPDAISADWPYSHICYIDISSVGEGYIEVLPRWMKLSDAPSRAKRLVCKGDVVLSTVRPNRRSIFFASQPGDDWVVSTGFAILRARTDLIEPRFLYACVFHHSFTEYLISREKGAAYPAVAVEDIANAEISLPPLSEQRAIAHILGTLDDKIELNRRMNRTLEATARAIFKSWFVDFDPVHAKAEGREPVGMDSETAALFSDSFQDSPLGKIPKGWEVGVLGDLCKVQIGGDWGKDEPFEGGIGVRCLRGVDLGHLRDNGAADAPVRWIKQASFDKRRMNAQDVLIATSGAGPLGRVLWVSPDLAGAFHEPVLYSNFCKRLRADTEAEAIHLDAVLAEMRESGAIWDFSTGTSVPNLDMSGLLESREVAIPPLKALESFSKLVRPLWARRYSQENDRLELIRDCLLPKLLSGQIDVRADVTDARRVDGD